MQNLENTTYEKRCVSFRSFLFSLSSPGIYTEGWSNVQSCSKLIIVVSAFYVVWDITSHDMTK